MVSNHRWGSNEGGAFTAAVGTKPHKKSIQDGVIARGDVSNTSPLMSQGGKAGIRSDGDARTWDVRNPNIERLSDSIIQYSQNVTILHRLVQSLGGIKDSQEVREHYTCQEGVVNDLEGRIEGEFKLQSREPEGLSRVEAARLRTARAKLMKDFNRVEAIAQNLKSEAKRRKDDTDRKSREQINEKERISRQINLMNGNNGGIQYAPEQQLMIMEEESMKAELGISHAIIEETEVELRQINSNLQHVNEIFKELAILVAQQGDQVDQIEVATESAHQRAQAGYEQVEKASNYNRGLCCIQ
eukprot:310726_1